MSGLEWCSGQIEEYAGKPIDHVFNNAVRLLDHAEELLLRIEQSLSVGELENTFRCLAAALRYLSLSLSGIEKRRLEYHASRVDVLLTYTKALSYWLKRGSRRGLGRARDQMMREINEIRNYLALVVKPNLSATLWK